jgi:hypothetical protein
LIQNGGPATGRRGIGHYSQKSPAKRDRLLTFWRILDVLCCATCQRHRIWTSNAAGIDAYPQHLSDVRFCQKQVSFLWFLLTETLLD